jgi:hypothetical protein
VTRGLGIIPLRNRIELAQLRCSGHVVRMGDNGYHKIAWQAGTQGKRPNQRPQQTWEEGIQKILKEGGIEWNGIRAIAGDSER